jgi:alpha-beta hydrolase superfamily lysophospholipase
VSLNPIEHQSKSFALLVHGLNTRPSSMASVSRSLNAAGIHVTPVTLAGHEEFPADATRVVQRERRTELRRATRERWHADVEDGYRRLSEIAHDGQRFFVGYSLGGLLGVELILAGRLQFDRMILLAPALAMHTRNNLLRLLRPAPNLLLPSLMPRRLRVHRWTPLSVYLELFRSVDALRATHDVSRLDIPTRVFVDPRDELVSAPGIAAWVAESGFVHWQIEPVTIGRFSLRRGCFRHLITDPSCLGEPAWEQLAASITDFLTQPAADETTENQGTMHP